MWVEQQGEGPPSVWSVQAEAHCWGSGRSVTTLSPAVFIVHRHDPGLAVSGVVSSMPVSG